MESKKQYLPPQLMVASVKPERGYAESNNRLAIFSSSKRSGSGNLESRQESGSVWGSDWNY